MSRSSPSRGGLSWPFDWDQVPYDPASGPFPEIPPVLPEDSSPSSCSPSSGIDLRTGRAVSVGAGERVDARGAEQWASDDGHRLGLVRLGDQLVAVDRDLQPLIQALNDAEVRTLTSCQGGGGDGYLMFLESDWKRFCGFWNAHQATIGASMIGRAVARSRDAEWAAWMRNHYPPHFPIDLDSNGLVTTVCWLFDLGNLLEVLPTLVTVLDSYSGQC